MNEETMAVAPSADNGNVSVMETEPVAPSEVTPEETPAPVEEPVVEATEVKTETFKLPDGREVTAEELYKEHTENLIPEFTRRSQELAQLKKGENLNNKPTESKFANPDYTPQTYEEILQEAEARAVRTIEAKEQARLTQEKAIQDTVSNQLAEVKKVDPTVNENALFLHANKYGFRDLKVAHQNMRDMSELAKSVKQATAKDVAKRQDPVSVSPGATGGRPEPSHFATAIDYLNALKASGK